MGASQSKTELVISAVDRATDVMNQIGNGLESLTKPANDVYKSFHRLYDATGLGKVGAALGTMTGSVKNLALVGLGLGGVYAGTLGKVFEFGVGAANAADNIGDLAEKYQIQANALQVFGALVEEDGGTIEDAAAAIGKLKKSMQAALFGDQNKQNAFAGVGISIEELRGMKPEELLERMGKAFAGSENDLAKQAVLLETMGKSGETMMGTLNRGADGIREKWAQMTADGRLFNENQLDVADKFDKTWQRLQGTFGGIKNELGLKLAEKFLPIMENVQKWAIANRELIDSKFDEFLEKLPAIIETASSFLSGLWSVIQMVGAAFRAVSSVFGSTGTALLLMAAVMSPMIIAASQLAWAVGLVSVKFGILAYQFAPAVMTGIRAVWALMLANPIGLIIAAVVGLSAIFYFNWDKIVSYVEGAWERIKAVFDVGFFDGVIQLWLEQWQAMANGILGIIKTILPDTLMPDVMKNFQFTFATDRATRLTAAQAASQKTEVGGVLKIQLEGAPAKVTEMRKTGQAMDIDVTTGLAMMG